MRGAVVRLDLQILDQRNAVNVVKHSHDGLENHKLKLILILKMLYSHSRIKKHKISRAASANAIFPPPTLPFTSQPRLPLKVLSLLRVAPRVSHALLTNCRMPQTEMTRVHSDNLGPQIGILINGGADFWFLVGKKWSAARLRVRIWRRRKIELGEKLNHKTSHRHTAEKSGVRKRENCHSLLWWWWLG